MWMSFERVSIYPLEKLIMSITAKPPFPAPKGKKWIFTKCFKHWRSGKLVYPKTAECFCFLVNA
jgi:hypothetical protein